MNREALAEIVQEGGRLITGLLQLYARRPQPPRGVSPGVVTSSQASDEPRPKGPRVTTKETIEYQKRELVKELTLLEGHLQEGCKINSKACDCCEKHPIKIEGLAQEAAGMTPDPVFREIAGWVKSIAPITTEAASASGNYDEQYPQLAIKARDFRKTLMNKEVKHEEANPATEA